MTVKRKPTREQVSTALATIANLHHMGHGIVIEKDQRGRQDRPTLFFVGISPAALREIHAGMTDARIVWTPGRGHRPDVCDVYGTVAAMPVHLGYRGTPEDLGEARIGWQIPTVRPATPERLRLLAALIRGPQPTAKHRRAVNA